MRCPKCLRDNVEISDVKLKTKYGYENPVKCLNCGYMFSTKIPKAQMIRHLGTHGERQEVVQVLDGVAVEHFDSVLEASRKTGIHRYYIEKCMNTGCKDKNGYSWRRV